MNAWVGPGAPASGGVAISVVYATPVLTSPTNRCHQACARLTPRQLDRGGYLQGDNARFGRWRDRFVALGRVHQIVDGLMV